MIDKIKMDALRRAMEKYGEALVLEIVAQLKAAGKEATGSLAKSIDYELIEALDTIAIGIRGENYLSVVDGGRRKGAKAPPTKAIIKWMDIKGIRGRDKKTGKFIKKQSSAFLIARSIGKNGIKGTYVIKKSIRKLQALQNKLLTDAAVEDMNDFIRGVFIINNP